MLTGFTSHDESYQKRGFRARRIVFNDGGSSRLVTWIIEHYSNSDGGSWYETGISFDNLRAALAHIDSDIAASCMCTVCRN